MPPDHLAAGGAGRPVAQLVPIEAADLLSLHPTMQNPVHYRKSGLSLNHIIGCPLECAYCIRHSVGAYAIKHPRLLMSDEDAVEHLLAHRHFRPHSTPLQLLNKATDPFLPDVKPHTLHVARLLDARGLHNHLLIITRYRVTDTDCAALNALTNLRVTLLITYSGIEDARIEPIANDIPVTSLRLAYKAASSYKVILYWRPLVPGLNDSVHHIAKAAELSHSAHATVFTGLFFRKEMQEYFKSLGLPPFYTEIARRKIMPKELESRILGAWQAQRGSAALFRKTSCGVAFAHSMADYNGHFGVPELCDICPAAQVYRCRQAFAKPGDASVARLAAEAGITTCRFKVGDGAITTFGMDEADRYFLQHQLAFQVHDANQPHRRYRHGRADIGWE